MSPLWQGDLPGLVVLGSLMTGRPSEEIRSRRNGGESQAMDGQGNLAALSS